MLSAAASPINREFGSEPAVVPERPRPAVTILGPLDGPCQIDRPRKLKASKGLDDLRTWAESAHGARCERPQFVGDLGTITFVGERGAVTRAICRSNSRS